jgi:ankyrin repeat protein
MMAPLTIAVCQGDAEAVTKALERPNAKLNKPDNTGKTALMYAAIQGHASIRTRVCKAEGP